ncbi:MAG: tRNA (adenosine(37)-N6)-threonylcarbamoyltransferase complex ATPase subunit type 1 TsaE [Candidatus Paceibacterota bacterium]|jgi:tRNA threonylcarbamoyladenosine biosynthesis protein TsaE
MKFLSKSLAETEKFAKDFVSKLAPKKDEATLVVLSGELGSGKTTFVQCVARALGVKENITSPTFVLIKKYQFPKGDFKILFHIDAYRLENGQELAKLGFEEIVANPSNLIFLEWPENVSEVLPADYLTIKFSFIDEATRAIEYRKIE